MKKRLCNLFLVLFFFTITTISQAQVTYFKGTLGEAIKEADKTERMVLFMASTSWCAPCKVIVKNVFSTVEGGNYFNPKFVVYKLELDKNDPENLTKQFNIQVYPTFIVFKAGKEISRFISGGANNTPEFISHVEKNLNPETSLEWQRKKYLSDPSYGDKFVAYLLEMRMKREAQNVIEEIFAREPFETKISETKLSFYDKNILSLDSPIIDFIVKNKLDVMRSVGKASYDNFFISRSVKAVPAMNAKELNIDNVVSQIKELGARAHLNSKYSLFLNENLEAITKGEGMKLIKAAQKAVVDCGTSERSYIVSVILRIAVNAKDSNIKSYNKELLKLYEICYNNEKSAEAKERYQNRINKLK